MPARLLRVWRGGAARSGRASVDSTWRKRAAFGRHHGKLLEGVAATDDGFLRWMLEKDFHADTLCIVRDALNGKSLQTSAGGVFRGGRAVSKQLLGARTIRGIKHETR